MNYISYIYISLGGALGALSRSLISGWVHNKMGQIFPWGTFVVNILGSFFLGFVYIIGSEKSILSSNTRVFLTVGFLGAFTTFSTFSLETLNIIKSGEAKIALLNTLGSLLTGLIAVWLGTVVATLFSK